VLEQYRNDRWCFDNARREVSVPEGKAAFWQHSLHAKQSHLEREGQTLTVGWDKLH